MKDLDKNYIDPEGYWIDPDRGIHRTSFTDPDGEQTVIASGTPECSEEEWNLIREALRMACEKRSIDFVDWYGRSRIN